MKSQLNPTQHKSQTLPSGTVIQFALQCVWLSEHMKSQRFEPMLARDHQSVRLAA